MHEGFLVYGIAAVVILVGGYVFLLGVRMCKSASKSRTWPSTTGVVRQVRVQERHGRKGRPTFQPMVRYRFTVAGRTYQGTRLWLTDHAGSKRYARRVLAQHPVGSAVTVYYAPGSPSNAVLHPGIDGNLLGLPFLGLLFMAAGAFVTWAYSLGLFHK